MKAISLSMKGGYYWIRKRVPRRYITVETRQIIHISLHTDSRIEAERRAPAVWGQMLDAWEAKLEGRDAEGEARLKAAMNLAHRRGWRYVDSAAFATLPLHEIINRVKSILDSKGNIDMQTADAALGLPETSGISVSEAVDEFYAVAADRVIGKSDDQLRLHRNPRKRAVASFINAVSDKPIADITTEDMYNFRRWLMGRVQRGEIAQDSANKEMTMLLATLKPVAQSKGIKLNFERDGLRLTSGGKTRTRPPFSEDWIRTKLLADGALQGLDTEARLIVLGMVNTGYRPGEGAGLLPEEIVLDSNVPHILIRPNRNRAIKNASSERYIPLTGISLEAFRAAKTGFPRYAQNSVSLSGTVNKYLASRGLLETPDHSLYSLRHAMEDRMLMANIDERVRMDILGHQIKRERYGKGGHMAFVQEQLMRIAL